MCRGFVIEKEWLETQYVELGKPMDRIAKEADCSYSAIRNSLIKYEIPIRDCYYSKRVHAGFPKELEDRDWLYQKYIEEKLSLNKIAKLLGTKFGTIRSALVRLEIPIRSKAAGQRLRYKDEGVEDYFIFDRSVIEGCLLGDGFLKMNSPKGIECYPAFAKRNIHFDHHVFVGKCIFAKSWDERIRDRGANSGFKNSLNIFELITLGHEELLPLYRDWYPESNDFKKVIPSSIQIDEKVLLHWFLDDGYSYVVRRKYKTSITTSLRIQFATQSFSKEDLEMLCGKVEDKFGLRMRPRFHQKHGKIAGTGYFVELSERKEQVRLFYDIIGEPPVPSLAYKWK